MKMRGRSWESGILSLLSVFVVPTPFSPAGGRSELADNGCKDIPKKDLWHADRNYRGPELK